MGTIEASRVFRHTVAPRTHSHLALQTVPHAACTIRPADTSFPGEPFRVYADHDGVVRFDVRPSGRSDRVAKFLMDCEAPDTTTHHALELRLDFEPTHEMPAPEHHDLRPIHGVLAARRALSDDEMRRLTHEQLLEGGYPLRPDPEAPRAFDAWRRAVSVPGAVVKPDLVERTDILRRKPAVKESTATFSNWSGFELPNNLTISGPGGFQFTHYDYVRGIWKVPAVTGRVGSQTYSSLWVGLDGDGIRDLVQAGTESDTATYGNDFVSVTFLTYYAWTEFLPQQRHMMQVTSVPVNAGDQVFVEVWIGSQGSGPHIDGDLAVFYLLNLTSGLSTYVTTPVGSTKVIGKEAVWIMERPVIDVSASGFFGQYGVFPLLSNYGSALMQDALAARADIPGYLGYMPYFGSKSKQITMSNVPGDTVMSTVTSLSSYDMRFDWKSFGEIDVAPPGF